MSGSAGKKTYATFGIERSWLQVRQALDDRRNAERNLALLHQFLLQAEARMAARLERPVENLRILEIGPGQGLERARYFGIKNEVIGLDLDVIPVQKSVGDYYRMLRINGIGRLAKTLGRKVIVGKANQSAWSKAVGMDGMKDPQMRQGDICGYIPELGQFDLVMSWSVFEHLPDPIKALENVNRLLKPGGILYLSIHLYTANNGHHDMRAFTGLEEKLPLWGHLRASTYNQIHPSCYLNQWRLYQWREMFETFTPGYSEFLEGYDNYDQYKSRITTEIKVELSEYSEEELFSVDAAYVWRKPGKTEEWSHVE
jgi:SAM-dependent methyltransferase